MADAPRQNSARPSGNIVSNAIWRRAAAVPFRPSPGLKRRPPAIRSASGKKNQRRQSARASAAASRHRATTSAPLRLSGAPGGAPTPRICTDEVGLIGRSRRHRSPGFNDIDEKIRYLRVSGRRHNRCHWPPARHAEVGAHRPLGARIGSHFPRRRPDASTYRHSWRERRPMPGGDANITAVGSQSSTSAPGPNAVRKDACRLIMK